MTTPAMRAPKGWGRRAGVGIAASTFVTALLLLLGELVARQFPSSAIFMVPSPGNCLQRSPSLGMEFVPNCAGTTWSETTFRTNSLGLRDAEIADDGAVRILAIGDSCTWGWKVAQDDAYPQVLQKLLDAEPGGRRYRVINAGRPGYTTHQGLIYLRHAGLQLQPAVVIIALGFNDGARTGDIAEDLAQQRRFMNILRLDDFLLDHSQLWRWARDATRGAPPTDRPPRVALDDFKRNLGQMIELVRSHSAKPLLLRFGGLPGGTGGPYGDATGEVAAALGVPLVVYAGPRIDIVHPTASGYARLAGAIRDRLHQEGYLEPAP